MKYSVLSKYRSELMGIAMLGVLFFHAAELDLVLPPLNLVRNMGFGGVDIFVLLSAMGITMSLRRRPRKYTKYMGRRLWRILPAYYAVMLPYTFYLLSAGRAEPAAFLWNALTLQFWFHPRGSFNWYITAIVLFYAVLPALIGLISGSKRPVAAVCVGWALSFAVCEALYYRGYWYYMDVFFRVPVLLEGVLLGLWIERDRAVTRRDVLVMIPMLLAGAGVGVMKLLELTEWAAYMFPFITVPVCLAICFIFERLSMKHVRLALRLLGESSLEIYLLDVSLFAEVPLLRGIFDPGPGHYAYYAVTMGLNILLGWALHKGIERLKRLTGSAKKSNLEIEQ